MTHRRQSKVVCFVLFWFVRLRSPNSRCFMLGSLGMFEEFWMGKGAPTRFETLWSNGVKAIDYWTIFSIFFWKIKTEKNYWNLEVFLVLLKSSWGVRFNRVYFTIFRAKMWKILVFEWILLLKIQKNCKNCAWKEKLVESSMGSHCRILKV
jgi:hypothetical protein